MKCSQSILKSFLWHTKPIFIRALSLHSFPKYWIIILRPQFIGAPKWFWLINFLQQTALTFDVRVKQFFISHWPKNVNTMIPKPSLTFNTSNVHCKDIQYCFCITCTLYRWCKTNIVCPWSNRANAMSQCVRILLTRKMYNIGSRILHAWLFENIIINRQMPSLFPGYGTVKPCLWHIFCVCVSLSSALKICWWSLKRSE